MLSWLDCAAIDMICEKQGASDCLAIVDIDSELKDPQVWSSYAPDIYKTSRVTEVCDVLMCFFSSSVTTILIVYVTGVMPISVASIKQSYVVNPNCFFLYYYHCPTAL